MKREKNPIDKDAAVSTSELAAWLGIVPATVRRLTKSGILHKQPSGYVLFDAQRRYCEHLRAEASNQPSGADGARLTKARARVAEAEAEMREQKLQQSRGELIEVSRVESRFVAIARQVRNNMLALPSRVGVRLPHLTRADIAEIAAEVHAALTELANAEPEPGLQQTAASNE